MAKQRKKNYKQFTIIKLEDGIIALGSLISGVAVNLKKYKVLLTKLFTVVTSGKGMELRSTKFLNNFCII